jgi:hypothetical protein
MILDRHRYDGHFQTNNTNRHCYSFTSPCKHNHFHEQRIHISYVFRIDISCQDSSVSSGHISSYDNAVDVGLFVPLLLSERHQILLIATNPMSHICASSGLRQQCQWVEVLLTFAGIS